MKIFITIKDFHPKFSEFFKMAKINQMENVMKEKNTLHVESLKESPKKPMYDVILCIDSYYMSYMSPKYKYTSQPMLKIKDIIKLK